jgi:hypothetical protein
LDVFSNGTGYGDDYDAKRIPFRGLLVNFEVNYLAKGRGNILQRFNTTVARRRMWWYAISLDPWDMLCNLSRFSRAGVQTAFKYFQSRFYKRLYHGISDPFDGKVIAITGAGSGIGGATAQYLAIRGGTISLADIKKKLWSLQLHGSKWLHQQQRSV